jgi:hypothetical protein
MLQSLLWRGRPTGCMADIFSLEISNIDVRFQGPLLGWKRAFTRLILSLAAQKRARTANNGIVFSIGPHPACHIPGLYNSGRSRRVRQHRHLTSDSFQAADHDRKQIVEVMRNAARSVLSAATLCFPERLL